MTKEINPVDIYKCLNLEDLPGEVWRDIEGFEGAYQVSNLGRVKSLARVIIRGAGIRQPLKERILRLNVAKIGYLMIGLWSDCEIKMVYVHRLVATAFIPNPENKREVNHKNGRKDDSRIENLEWVTPGENMKHSYLTGLKKPRSFKGEHNTRVKLTEAQVIMIRKMIVEGGCYSQIARDFNVKFSTIWGAVRGKSWGWLTPTYEELKQQVKHD